MIRKSKTAELELLMDSIPVVEAMRMAIYSEDEPLLWEATREGDLDSCKLLHEYGAPLDKPDPEFDNLTTLL